MVKGWEPPACSLRRNRFFACLPPQHCYSHGELQLLMQYLVSCMTEFLFPLGERSIFLQEHTQIRISSKHTLPVRHSCEAVKWHFHLWNGGGFLTAQQNLIVVRFFSPLLLHLVLFFPTVLWLPELAFSSPAFSDFFFFPAPLWREISILKLWVHALTSVWISKERWKGGFTGGRFITLRTMAFHFKTLSCLLGMRDVKKGRTSGLYEAEKNVTLDSVFQKSWQSKIYLLTFQNINLNDK